MRVLIALLAVALLLPLAAAHTAAPPRAMEVRLLHDCNDDYIGDSPTATSRPGYDLHALDVREAWSQALGHHLVFRLVLNGDGPSNIKLALQADGASKSYSWTTSGNSWTGTFDEVHHITNLQDGERFALEGAVKRSRLAVDVGDELTGYTLTGSDGGDEHDHVPGNDSGLGGCSDNFQRPDYELKGPVQYVGASFDESSVSVQAGREKFVALRVTNLLRDAAQSATISLDGDLRLHNPDTNQYVQSATFDLNKKGSAGSDSFIHVAVTGDTPGTGTATATITTNLGGRVAQSLEYTITEGAATTTTSDAPDGEDAPGVGWLVPLVALALFVRRR